MRKVTIFRLPTVLFITAFLAMLTTQDGLAHCKGKHTDEGNWPAEDHCSPDPDPPPAGGRARRPRVPRAAGRQTRLTAAARPLMGAGLSPACPLPAPWR